MLYPDCPLYDGSDLSMPGSIPWARNDEESVRTVLPIEPGGQGLVNEALGSTGGSVWTFASPQGGILTQRPAGKH